eukprot:TRINITY_DN3054_c1_g1_i3.p1 TRINITY_DN3054_c1_g1~~TRINITY_DN3054_c1_g1_i3.p1  ORF type:complete len:508 (+),score=254.31 TRINITY_DN3054_c1_g1_i3:65-1525(+)
MVISPPETGSDVLNYVGGALVPARAGAWIESLNPSTGALHVRCPASEAADVSAAVEAASAAFASWSATTVEARSAVMMRVADAIEANLEAFALCESRDQGKPVSLARSVDIPRAVKNFRFFATAILHERHGATTAPGIIHVESPMPIGVCGLVSPWNLPLYLLTWKIAPCMAAGCTMVAKPSELTPATASMLAQVMIEAGVPAGVVNIVHGYGPSVGPTLCGHPKVKAVSFTGGTATARHIVTQSTVGCHGPIRKMSLELGGKNAAIVFADADLKVAAATTARSAFANQGEICLCTSRILVERSAVAEFTALLVEHVRALTVGDPLAAETRCGALVSAQHRDKVQGYIDLAVSEGAEVLCGGGRPADLPAALAGGYYIAPTVLAGLPHSSRVCQEEIFGPVAAIVPFDTEAEALEMANGTEYGLAASLWTDSASRAQRVASQLQAGNVWVNCWMVRDLRCVFARKKNCFFLLAFMHFFILFLWPMG